MDSCLGIRHSRFRGNDSIARTPALAAPTGPTPWAESGRIVPTLLLSSHPPLSPLLKSTGRAARRNRPPPCWRGRDTACRSLSPPSQRGSAEVVRRTCGRATLMCVPGNRARSDSAFLQQRKALIGNLQILIWGMGGAAAGFPAATAARRARTGAKRLRADPSILSPRRC